MSTTDASGRIALATRSVGIRGPMILLAGLLATCQTVGGGGGGKLELARSESAAKIANPASGYCSQSGGDLRIETLGNRGQIGVCWFEDERRCEEWALFRGACPVGGLHVTGYLTPGARYCVIRGGHYEITRSESAGAPEQGLCTLPDGTRCDAGTLWNGGCG